jgi:hypothetical protein
LTYGIISKYPSRRIGDIEIDEKALLNIIRRTAFREILITRILIVRTGQLYFD